MTEIRVITQNIDYTLKPEGWQSLLNNLTPKADVILFQEAKFTDLRQYLSDEWGVYQDTSNSARQGSAVIWRKSMFRRVNHGLNELTKAYGARMETRYIAWVDLKLKDKNVNKTIRFGSVHFPPKRFSWLWTRSRASTRAWLKAARRANLPFVLGGDYNLDVDGHGVAALFKLATRNFGIDGFIVSRRLKSTKAQDLGDNRSDHNPVRTIVSFKNRKR